ncbi:MAG: tyrosine-type recombinase/integrase [Oscillospiraceae bacterium]|nr:tyrosine-type recombinase/integrase [Oscillospiraceae bacterium]
MQDLNRLIEKYLLACQYHKGLNQKTIKAYRIDLQQFSGQASEQWYSREQITNYLVLLQQKYRVRSVKRKIASIKAFFNYLEYEELLPDNPFLKIRIKLNEPFLLPRTIPLPTIEQLLSQIYKDVDAANSTKQQRLAAIRDAAVIELLFASGMRVSELCTLKPENIDLSDGMIRIWGKGAKERILQVGNETVLAALRSYNDAYKTQIQMSESFFVNRLGNPLSEQSVRFMIVKYADEAGITLHITPHMFRHSFATFLLEEDVDIRYIQRLLGHSSITTTQIYTHVTAKKQRDILYSKHPRNKLNI